MDRPGVLQHAVAGGIDFIDTADVYSDGDSEKAVGRSCSLLWPRLFVASKCGRQLSPHVDEAYTPQAMRTFVEASLSRLRLEVRST